MTDKDNERKTSDVTTFTVCGVQGCCPTVEVHNITGEITIRDDSGGSVRLNKEQLFEAAKKVEEMG